ncbi:uncharacterized protein [Watersipora subatra]|uniref:uncharacterized protein n=1 Tax=Watersipora subatra TaxID=2589382 RepID=UPI00355B6E6A
MVQTITTGTTRVTRTTHHDLSLGGRAGAVLIILLVCFATFLVAFTTSGWSGYRSSRTGLWESCSAISSGPSYHTATQVLMCLALIGLAVAVILVFLYLFAHTVSKYQVLLGLVIDSFITFALMLVAVIVYGASASNVSWSFGVACIATILCMCAAIVAAIQLARC